MSVMKHILVLANSARTGKHCVAGKVVTVDPQGYLDIHPEWIRLSDPNEKDGGGAIAYGQTIIAQHGLAQPLDVIRAAFLGPCDDPDHPEDWYIDTRWPWEFKCRLEFSILERIADRPAKLWDDGASKKGIRAGYVRQMAEPASLYLIKAPPNWEFRFWKEWSEVEQKEAFKKKLLFNFAGVEHQLAVTDLNFTGKHGIYEKATASRQKLAVPQGDAYFCLSLTKLTDRFNDMQYKVCATIFQE